MSKYKICFVASLGGHLEEISRLKKIAQKYDSFLVTEKSTFDIEGFCEKKYYVPITNRKQWYFPVLFIYEWIKAGRILRKEKPDVVITTGALISYPFTVRAKKMGAKIIYIESFARVNTKSLTGKLTEKYADLFIVQWPEMLELYPKAKLGGGIF